MAYVETANYRDASAMLAGYAAARARLWKPRKAVIAPVLPFPVKPERIWNRLFNAHVDAYHAAQEFQRYCEATGEVFIPRAKEQRVWIPRIIEECARHFGVSVLDIKSARRTRQVVKPRQVAMYFARTMTPRSLPDIGRLFGGRDHTTILFSVRRVNAMISAGDPVIADIAAISKALQVTA